MTSNAVELWSIASSIASVVLAVLAIALSVYFFVIGRRTETSVSTSLSKIETQAEMLQKITGKQLDRLTRFVTEERPRPEDPQFQRMVEVFIQLAQPLSGSIAQTHQRQPDAQVAQELISCYIGLYYYAAVTNYWAQQFLPGAADYDDANEYHKLARKVVDQSASDFNAMAAILTQLYRGILAQNPLVHILEEAKGLWRDSVRSAADVFLARERAD